MAECPNCYHEIPREAVTCPNCGFRLRETSEQDSDKSSEVSKYRQDKYALVAAILALFLGWCGAHDYYLKNTDRAKKKTIIFIVAFCSLIIHSVIQESDNGIFWMIWSIGAWIVGIWAFANFIKIWRGNYHYPESINLIYHSYAKFIYIIVLVLCSILGFSYIGLSSKTSAKEVALSLETLPEYPDVFIGTMIDSLIANPKWELASDSTNYGDLTTDDIINVSGKITYMGKPATLAIGFKINSNGEPYVYAMELNGTPQNRLWITAILDRMYELATTDGIVH